MLPWLVRQLKRFRVSTSADDVLSAEQEIELNKRAIVEVASRTRAGFFAYPLVWILSMQGGQVFSDQRAYVLWHALGLGLVGAVRLAWCTGLRSRLDRHFLAGQLVFRTLMLLHGLYWAGLLTVCMLAPEQAATRQFIVPVTVALVITGAMMMAIDDVLGLVFPVSMVGPPLIALLVVGDPTGKVYAFGAVSLVLYGLAMSRLFRRDYFRSERARFLLEDRARGLEELSMTDGLTQVRNRLFIERHLPLFWKEGRRQQQPLSIALVDLDHFKKINDHHGHGVGDECLRHAAQALQRELSRPSDVVGRYGGEEFLVLMPNTDEAGARQVADRLLASIRATVLRVEGRELSVTCSIGLCTVVPHGDDDGAQLLMRRADEALYEAKAQGRDRVVVSGLPAFEGPGGGQIAPTLPVTGSTMPVI